MQRFIHHLALTLFFALSVLTARATAPVDQNFESATITASAGSSLAVDTVTYVTNGVGKVGVYNVSPFWGVTFTNHTGKAIIANLDGSTSTGITTFRFGSTNTADKFKLNSLVAMANEAQSGYNYAAKYKVEGFSGGSAGTLVVSVAEVDLFTSGTYGTGNAAIVYARDGSLGAGVGNGGSLTFGSSWDNIDTVVFTVTDGKALQLSLDTMDFSAPTPTANTFDLAGNALTLPATPSPNETYILAPADSTPPTVSSINRADANNTNAASVNFTVTLSESVTGVDTTDFTLTPGGTASGTISGISGSGTTYTVTVNAITGAGTLRLDLKSSGTGIADAATNAIATGFTSGQSYNVDRVAPTVSSITRADANNTNAASVNFTVTFGETVTGVDATDFTLTPGGTASGTISGISGSGTTYTVTVNTIAGEGTLRVDLKSSGTGITDAAANAIAAGFTSGQSYNVDRVAPVITSSTTASGSQNVLFSYSITASGSAVSYGATGMPSGLSVTPSTGEISGTPTQSGLFNISLTATDAAGNIGTGSVALTLAASLSYNDWKALHFNSGQQADSAISGPDADPDGDGMTNLMEYALDSDPLVPSVGALPVLDTVDVSSSTYLRLTIPRKTDRTDVSPVVELSADLNNPWSSSGVVTITNTATLLVVRDNTPINGTARFIRWNIATGATTPAMGGRLTNINPGTTAAPVSNPSGQPFARAAVWRGFADSASGTSLTVAGTPWTAGQFTATPHYLTVLEGSMAGLNLEVTANTSSSLTLGSSLDSILVSGQRFELRPHHTIASLFGASNPTSFAGGSTASNADELQVFDNATQVNTRYFYQTSGFGGTGWHPATGTISNRSGSIIDPEQGFDIVNKKGGSRTFLAIGEARTQPQAMLVAVGKNWFVVSQPVTVSLQDFGIYTGSSSNGLVGSSTLKSADEFQHWNGSTWDRFYYKTGVSGDSGWRSTANTSVDRGSESLHTGDVIIIQRKASPDFLFFRPAAP